MKRFFTVIALAMCITVGGVYAAWSYSANADILDASQQRKIQMADPVSSGADGAYSVSVSNLEFLIDDANVDHYPELVANGELVLIFTPSTNASADVKANGVQSYFNIVPYFNQVAGDEWTYGGAAIFTFDFDEHVIGRADSAETLKWTDNGDGTLICTIPAADIASHIELNTTILLDTLDDYHSYSAELSKGYISFELGDKYSQTP